MNEFLINWTASIDHIQNDFRAWYSLIQIPTNVADITIKIIETYAVNQISSILNMTFADILGTTDLMSMSLKSFLFIIIYR